MMVTFDMHGIKQAMNLFEQLPKAVANTVLRQSIRHAMTPVRAALRRRTRAYRGEDATGALRRVPIVTKVFTGRRQGITRGRTGLDPKHIEIVVARSNVRRIRRPARYFHLLEFGTRKAAARPLLRPAVDETKALAEARFRTKFAEAVAKQADRLAYKKARS